VVSGGNAKALGLNYEMRCREVSGRRTRQRRRCRRHERGKGTERAANRARVMFAVLVGLSVRVPVSAEQRQQAPLGIIDLSVGAALRRFKGFSDIEGEVDRHQRVEDERKETEPGDPDFAPPRPHPHAPPITPAKQALI